MKIRTALVLACFLLSAVPLGGIVTYSYFSSRRALESAYHAEAARLTAQMDRRLGNIRDELQQRLAEVSALPNLPNSRVDKDQILMTIGDLAPLVHSLEIQPMPRSGGPSADPATPALAPPAPPAAKSAAAPEPPEPIVIDVPPAPQMPRFTFSDAERAQLRRIAEVGHQLGERWNSLTPEERDALQHQIDEAQKKFSDDMKAKQDEFSKHLSTAIEQRMNSAQKTIRVRVDKEAALAFGQRLDVPVTHRGTVVSRIQARVSDSEIIRRILGNANDEHGEITFAIDRQGTVYTRTPEERATLDRAGITQRAAAGKPLNDIANWAVALKTDPASGLRVGVARPFGEDLEGLRKTAARNFGYGMALLFVALIGIVPVANHLTRDVELVTRGAERIAKGDLATRLPVRSGNEMGQLAAAFNRMAGDLSLQRQRIVEQERAAVEYERKSAELEQARHFQLSMLPKEVPRHPLYDIAVFTHTATEVGGDYYDFHVEGDGSLSITIGDATGHGARAGTMVAVIKALFAGYSERQTPAEFLREATGKVRRMDLARMAMALQLARFDGDSVTLASAGMPPAYLHRRGERTVEEIAVGATPLGMIGDDYRDIAVRLRPGDTVLFLSDGFPELMNESGQQLGYGATAEAFAAAAEAPEAGAVIASLAGAVRRWHGDQPPNDDVTFVVVRAREADRSSSA